MLTTACSRIIPLGINFTRAGYGERRMILAGFLVGVRM